MKKTMITVQLFTRVQWKYFLVAFGRITVVDNSQVDVFVLWLRAKHRSNDFPVSVPVNVRSKLSSNVHYAPPTRWDASHVLRGLHNHR